jgi:hypothetical protein
VLFAPAGTRLEALCGGARMRALVCLSVLSTDLCWILYLYLYLFIFCSGQSILHNSFDSRQRKIWANSKSLP